MEHLTAENAPEFDRCIDFPLIIVFAFAGDRMTCERTYFDLMTLLVQLGVGPAPASPD